MGALPYSYIRQQKRKETLPFSGANWNWAGCKSQLSRHTSCVDVSHPPVMEGEVGGVKGSEVKYEGTTSFPVNKGSG